MTEMNIPIDPNSDDVTGDMLNWLTQNAPGKPETFKVRRSKMQKDKIRFDKLVWLARMNWVQWPSSCTEWIKKGIVKIDNEVETNYKRYITPDEFPLMLEIGIPGTLIYGFVYMELTE